MRPIDDSSGEGAGLLDLCFDPDEGPEVRLQRAELRGHLTRAIEQLPAREKHVLAMYYHQ